MSDMMGLLWWWAARNVGDGLFMIHIQSISEFLLCYPGTGIAAELRAGLFFGQVWDRDGIEGWRCKPERRGRSFYDPHPWNKKGNPAFLLPSSATGSASKNAPCS